MSGEGQGMLLGRGAFMARSVCNLPGRGGWLWWERKDLGEEWKDWEKSG